MAPNAACRFLVTMNPTLISPALAPAPTGTLVGWKPGSTRPPEPPAAALLPVADDDPVAPVAPDEPVAPAAAAAACSGVVVSVGPSPAAEESLPPPRSSCA